MSRTTTIGHGTHKRVIVCTLALVLTACCNLSASAAAATGSGEPALRAASASYDDPIGDAGDAPDIANVTITPASPELLRFRVTLAAPTELGRYGWILVGLDTDQNRYTGGVLGNDFLVLANGENAVLARWLPGGFTTDFEHRALDAVLSSTAPEFTVDRADLRTSRFDFSVASLREDADLAPDQQTFTYRPAGTTVPLRLAAPQAPPSATCRSPRPTRPSGHAKTSARVATRCRHQSPAARRSARR